MQNKNNLNIINHAFLQHKVSLLRDNKTDMQLFKERNLRRLRRSQRDGVCFGANAILPFARSEITLR